jgi:hypothetical protein
VLNSHTPEKDLTATEAKDRNIKDVSRLKMKILAARRIFGPKRDEVTEEWRKLHTEELNNLYSSPDIVRQIKSR